MFSEKVAPESKFEDVKVDDSRLPESDAGSKDVKLEEINPDECIEEQNHEYSDLLKQPPEPIENQVEENTIEEEFQRMKENLANVAITIKSKFEIKTHKTSDCECIDIAYSKKNSLMVISYDSMFKKGLPKKGLLFYDLNKINEYLKTVEENARNDEKELKKCMSRFDKGLEQKSFGENPFDNSSSEIVESLFFETIHGNYTQLILSKDETKLYCATEEGYIIVFTLPVDSKIIEEKRYEKIKVAKKPFIFDIFGERIFFQKLNKCYLKEYNKETKTSKYIFRLDNTQKLLASQTGIYLAAIGKNIIVYKFEELKYPIYKKVLPKSFIESFFEKNNVYADLQFSYDDEYFIYSYENVIKIVDAEQWVEKKDLSIPLGDSICSIKLAPISNQLVAISQLKKLYVWDIHNNNTNPIFTNYYETYNPSRNYMMKLEINEENGYAYVKEMKTSIFYYYNCNIFSCKEIANAQNSSEKILINSKKNEIIFLKNNEPYMLKDNKPQIIIFDFEKNILIKTIEFQERIIDIIIENEKEDCLYVLTKDCISVFSTASYIEVLPKIKFEENKFKSIFYININQESKVILLDNNDPMGIHQLRDSLIQNEVCNFGDLTDICILKIIKDCMLISSQSSILAIYDLNTRTIKSRSIKFNSEIIGVFVISKPYTVFATFYDETIRIFESGDLNYFAEIKVGANISKGFITQDEKFFVSNTTWNSIIVYSLPLFIVVFEINEPKFESINTSPLNFSMIGLSNQRLIIYKDIFSTSNPVILGESVNFFVVEKFLKNNYHISNHSEDSDLDRWTLFPYMLNSIHFYSAENNKKEIKHAMQLRNVPFLESCYGTPLDISLIADNGEVSNYLIKELAENIKNDPNSLKLISKNFVQINTKSFKSLELLYDNCFVPYKDSETPDYCDDSISLPKIYYSCSDALIVQDSPEFHKDLQNTTHRRVHFYNSAFKISLKIGSEGSIQFLKSLAECNNFNIFKTKFINCILNDKWNKIKWVHYTYSGLFIIYLLFLSMFSVNQYWPYMYIAVAANSIMNLYEVLQCATGPLIYLKDIFNYFDIVKSVLLYVYLSYNSRYLLVIASCLSWIRGITIFTLFRSTRPMINMLYYVFYDIGPFMYIMFYSILAFAFIQSTFNDNSSQASGELILDAFYNIVGGSSPGEDGLETFLIVVNSIFNVIIMLNLLISIIGKTFEDVNNNQQIEDMSKVCELIIEVEYLINFFKIQNEEFYIQLCDEYSPEIMEGEEEVQYKLKGIKDHVEKLENRALESQKKILKSIMQLEETNKVVLKNMQINNLDVISHINKTAITAEKQCEVEGSSMCVKSHELSLKIVFKPYICDYCYKEFKNYVYYCKECDLAMCLNCEAIYKKDYLSKYTCCLGHRLIYYGEDNEFLTWEKLDANICRYCNKEFKKNGLYCALCLFFICGKCETLLNQYVQQMMLLTCKKNHKLAWKQHDNYEDSNLIEYCFKCNIKYIGAGFYFCNKCKSNLCIRCLSDKANNS